MTGRSSPEPKISELEQKLIRLALDKAAQPGEIAACAQKLIEQWRKRGVSAEEIFGAEHAQHYSKPDYGLVRMPFGKHKGQPLKNVPVEYLIWLSAKMSKDADDSVLYRAILAFLQTT